MSESGLFPRKREREWGMAGERRTNEGHADEWGLVMPRTPEKTGGGGLRIKMIVMKTIAMLKT